MTDKPTTSAIQDIATWAASLPVGDPIAAQWRVHAFGLLALAEREVGQRAKNEAQRRAVAQAQAREAK